LGIHEHLRATEQKFQFYVAAILTEERGQVKDVFSSPERLEAQSIILALNLTPARNTLQSIQREFNKNKGAKRVS
jgi:hypothetical protein